MVLSINGAVLTFAIRLINLQGIPAPYDYIIRFIFLLIWIPITYKQLCFKYRWMRKMAKIKQNMTSDGNYDRMEDR